MKTLTRVAIIIALFLANSVFAQQAIDFIPIPRVPGFSIDYMDRSIIPGADFYQYAAGSWVRNNPVPPDKSRWAAFSELQDRNYYLIRQILEDAAKDANAAPKSPQRMVGDFFASAMDTDRIEQLGFVPISDDLRRIDAVKSTAEFFTLLADFHNRGIGGLFNAEVWPDAKNSSIYAMEITQGGLSLPDRDYYINDSFAAQRQAFVAHVTRMHTLLGERPDEAAAHANTVSQIESALARASRTRVELRDPVKNYNKFTSAELIGKTPALLWIKYFEGCGLDTGLAAAGGRVPLPYAVIGQPEFFQAIDQLVRERPLPEWKVYLRWHLLRSSAPYLHRAAEEENFEFFGKVLSGQLQMEPRWKRSARTIDRGIGEALGQMYVEKHFPPAARVRMNDLVENLKLVFRERLLGLDWMTNPTRIRALAKFDRFTQKIGFPEKFRDYSSVEIRRDDFLGNVRRARAFEVHRKLSRIGKPVDRTEWEMSPPTVNAYFNPVQNEIVFPAGILQPPFFDVALDDPVNYGAIGVVIGHEITHGFDDEGRKFDADGNLTDWWTEADAKAFESRAQKVVEQYGEFEALPGLRVNGQLTLGENIADLGGVTIAYEALQRALSRDPNKRRLIDNLTPEQRFFISYAQIWRSNVRDTEARRLITVDPHSPGRFRSVGPLVNLSEFYHTFEIKPADPMWRPVERRAKIW